MKTLFKILVILLSAMLVVGAAYAVRQTDWGSSLLSSGGDHAEGTEMLTDGERPTPPDGDFDGGDFDRDSASSLSLESFISFAKTLVPVSLIILLLNATLALFQTLRRRFQRVPA